MVEILNMKDDIIKVLFWLNIASLIIAIFASSIAYYITIICINIVFNGTFVIISKFSHMFDPRQNRFGKLGGLLDVIDGMGQK